MSTEHGKGGGSERDGVELDGLARRDFLKLVGVTASAAAVSCQEPTRRLNPYIEPQGNALVGESTYYATVCRECPAGCGLHVRVREGRAIKLEGNPDHPVNRGKLCARGQAGLLRTYSPERIRRPLEREGGTVREVGWERALRRVGAALTRARGTGEGRVVVWSGLETGLVAGMLANLATATGGQHIIFDPHQMEPLLEAHRAAFGRYEIPRYRLSESDLVVALEADLFETYHSPVELARQIIGDDHRGGHRATLVWVGPRRGITGMLADHWIPIRPGASGYVALALVGELLERSDGALAAMDSSELRGLLRSHPRSQMLERAGMDEEDLRALAERLLDVDRRPVVLPPGPVATGPLGSAGHAAVVLLNEMLGVYRGGVLSFGGDSALARISRSGEIRACIERMAGGGVDVLLIAGANPLFDLPPPLMSGLERVGLTVAIADKRSATTDSVDMVLPAATPLESWGDYAPRAGVVGLMQPVMRPLYGARMLGDILIGLAREAQIAGRVSPEARTFDVGLRKSWTDGLVGAEATESFREARRRGGFFEEPPTQEVALAPEIFSFIGDGFRAAPDEAEGGTYYLAPFAPVGSGLNERPTGGWLAELPEPTNAAVWGAAAELHPDLARALDISQGDTIEVVGDNSIRLPVVVRDTVRADTVAVPLGGRTRSPELLWPHVPSGRPADESPAYRGSSAAYLLTESSLREGAGIVRAGQRVRVTPIRDGESVRLFVESRHFEQHGRLIARARGLEGHGSGEAHHDLPLLETEEHRRQYDLHHIREYQQHRWAMAIDLDKCTACSACIVACYAENNIHVVGPEHVDYGRELHWLQIHTYWERDHAGRSIPLYLPVLCQHCHQAPCESVCPVYAPYHNPEGLNGQVYNRCVGTRFCSNNCPYKVRRFNWHDWVTPEPLHLQLNPDVTVRTAGVMEKCSFCIQRIREAKEEAKLTNRELQDGDVVPACVQTCPTGALVFGDWLDERSALRRLVEDQADRGYHLLSHVGTRPAITYLEREVRWRT